MKIKSHAAPTELTSPFYKKNEDFCREFENYIASKDGKIKGNYNAWSYFIQGEIMAPKPWQLKYKKATYTSTGNLLLSSKKQSLLTLAEWSTSMPGSFNSEFIIIKRGSFGFLKKLFKNSKTFQKHMDYLITGCENNNTLIDKLYQMLKPLFKEGKIYSIVLQKNILTISLRTETHHFKIFENLLRIF